MPNHLTNETSPYLLQHVNNPVDWYPWGEEALALAYELRLRKTKWEESKKYGDRQYENLVRIDFESYNPKLKTTERFTLAVGTEGEWKGVPVYVKYQPKWWFKAEGVIDESQVFGPTESVRNQPDEPALAVN